MIDGLLTNQNRTTVLELTLLVVVILIIYNFFCVFVCLFSPPCAMKGLFRTFVDVVSARTAVGHDAEGKLVLFQIDGQTGIRG